MSTFKVTDLKTADECLSLISKATFKIKRIETGRDEAIHKAKLKVKEELLCLREQIEQYEIALGEFGESNKNLFMKPRSHELTFGTIGYHEGTKLETTRKVTWKKVMLKLLKLKKRSGLRFIPSINKDKLKNWPDEDLKEIGVKKTTEDHFSYALKDDH